MRRALAILLSAACLLDAPRASATPPPDAEVRTRLAYLQRAFQAEQPRAREWRTIWLVTFGALAAGQGGFALVTKNDGLKIDAEVGGVKSGLAFLSLLFAPHAETSVADQIAALPEDTPAERAEKLRTAEALLVEAGKQQRFRQSWVPRVAGDLVNLAGAYVLWKGYKRYASGWLSIGSGLAVGELEFRTAPDALAGADDRYRAGPASQQTGWTLVPQPGGLAVTGSF